MKKLLFFIFFLSIYTLIFSQEVKNALLIANNNYGGNVASLPRPVQEARELKRALESIGFDVIIVENANREKMVGALFNFKEKCEKEGGIAFFHYGGHAVQIDGVNYLLPANTQLETISQVHLRCVNVDDLMKSMRGDANIVVLDSCRDNPFKSDTRGGTTTRGLVGVKNQPDNSIIVYSAKANKTATDGVFTPIFTKYVIEENVSIEEMLKKVRREVIKKTNNEQIPGEYGELTGSIYLAGRNSGVAHAILKGFVDISTYTPTSVVIDNEYVGEIEAFSQKRFEISTGLHNVKIKYKDGKSENTSIVIKTEKIAKLEFKYLSKEQLKLSVTLAFKYLKGLGGVQKDYKQAFEYAKIAADADDNEREYILGYCFELGLGITKNEEKALYWYRKAQKKGNGDAMYKLGMFYHYGKGKLNIDYKEAKNWYEKAIKANCSEEVIKSVRNVLNEINALIEKGEEREKAEPHFSDTFCSLEINFGYNISHFTTKKKELVFNSHGFTLGLTEARFHLENGFDIKIKTDYTLCVKKFTTETIIYNEFNFIFGQFGYKYKWFAFHIGFAPSFQWETVTTFNSLATVSNFSFGFKFSGDLEFNIYDRYILYVEYGPRFSLFSFKTLIPLIQHSFNIGLQIKIIDYDM